ncbi:hypothetical protein B5F40_12955 [Gordonibacter sp. An230]|uniref:hypothetical protein n=1 Tax=Gordonibacter sp. An230 TaxID=1965592 RepID=UPI000B390356|nr:hypothetical protein [Gordonibacter sp. An230]OUO88048.1 hypothetical protein B5F40_12955 [Gordonibacter sp. An230]
MKKVLGALLALAVIVVGATGVLALSGSGALPGPLSNAVEGAKATATNAAIDASGLKDRVKDVIQANRDGIAAATGLYGDELDAAIDDLAIDSWKAAPLPGDAQPVSTLDGVYAGIEGSITTYDDPGYITVSAYGQNVTFAVPESAQAYLPYLALAQ